VDTVTQLDRVAKLVNRQELAYTFRMDANTVTKRLHEWRMEPVKLVGKIEFFDLRDWIDNWQKGNSAEGNMRPTDLLAIARTAEAEVDTDIKRLNLAQKRAELITASAALDLLATLAKLIVTALDSLADRMERDSGLTPSQVVKMRELVDKARDLCADHVRSAADEVVE